MKLCKYCKKYYSEKDFGVAKTVGDKIYRRLKCRFCFNKAKKQLRDKYKTILAEYKKERGCCKCGIKDSRVLEFHHPGDKGFTIGYASHNHLGIDRVKEEIKKCLVICANCHRILHYGKVWMHDGDY